MTISQDWRPYCGQEYGRSLSGLHLGSVPHWPGIAGPLVAGDPVVCDSLPHKTTGKYATPHRNSELGFSWW